MYTTKHEPKRTPSDASHDEEMNTPSTHHHHSRPGTRVASESDARRLRRSRTMIALCGSGLLLMASACSSGDSEVTSTQTQETTTQLTPPPSTSSTSSTTTAPSASTTTTPPTSSSVDQARVAELRHILDTHRAAGDFVGARIAVLGSDGSVAEASAGTTTVDPTSAPVDADTAWNIGSVTKTFVAVVVLQLAEEGRLDLDANISTFMPDLAAADRITPRELLQHTSGLGEYINDPAVLADAQRVWTPAELIAVAEAAGRVAEPGAAYHYSNTNYIILGEIIHDVTGHSWADELRTRIVEPLGMTNTGAITVDRPVGYQVVNGAFVDTTNTQDPSIGGAAGSLQSTGHDLLLFATALAKGTLLSPGSTTEMLDFVPGDDYSQFGITHSYGLGIEQYANDTLTMIGHMGTGNAQSAFIGFDPERGTAVAVMTNTALAGPQAIMAFEALTAAAQTD